jgi:hypothetical protein
MQAYLMARKESTMLCSLSKLQPGNLQSIGVLEKELGTPVLAFSCYDYEPAAITEDQLSRIRALEKELGLALVAIKR